MEAEEKTQQAKPTADVPVTSGVIAAEVALPASFLVFQRVIAVAHDGHRSQVANKYSDSVETNDGVLFAFGLPITWLMGSVTRLRGGPPADFELVFRPGEIALCLQ